MQKAPSGKCIPEGAFVCVFKLKSSYFLHKGFFDEGIFALFDLLEMGIL